MVDILQIGLGPLGQKIGRYIAERKGFQTVGAVDNNPALIGQDFGQLCGVESMQIVVTENIAEAIQRTKPDIVVLSTVSDMERITQQLREILPLGISVVSTCEELSYSWQTAPHLSQEIDTLAKVNNVAVLGTGVNPGFLMDALPTFLTSVAQNVDFVEVKRFQDARHRRLPFQRKIGAGLTLDGFEAKKQTGTLRHVGLTESMHMIAKRMGWTLDKTEDILTPIIATETIETEAMTIPKGDAMGVKQIGRGYCDSELKIELNFQAAVGLAESFDEVNIKGTPNITSKIEGGVNGDIATCAIIINAIPQVLRANAGLKTMLDIPLVSFV